MLTKYDVIERLRANATQPVPSVLTGDEDLRAYMDSLGTVEFMIDLEERAGLIIGDDQVDKLRTINDVVAFLSQPETV